MAGVLLCAEMNGEIDSDKTFISMVIYFTKDKGDPTSYAGWDEDRCRRLMPAWHSAWVTMKTATEALDRIGMSYRDHYN